MSAHPEIFPICVGPETDWGDVPEADRAAWSISFCDFAPWFPGITVMGAIGGNALAGRALEPWVPHARALHAAGFTPTDYYLLCQDLDAWERTGKLTRAAHRHLFLQWREPSPYRFFVLDLTVWGRWPVLVREGLSPRRATTRVLAEGSGPSSPLGGRSR